jgi:hypothetical protein
MMPSCGDGTCLERMVTDAVIKLTRSKAEFYRSNGCRVDPIVIGVDALSTTVPLHLDQGRRNP